MYKENNIVFEKKMSIIQGILNLLIVNWAKEFL